MPIDIQALPSDSINSKWKDPYASASLNRRPVGIVPPGIYRGLLLTADPLFGDRTINIDADIANGDHVAVFETEDGFSVNYRDEASGDITVSLDSYASVDVVVTLLISYQIGVSTTGSLRGYTQAEFDGLGATFRDSLVVLGTVSVPASGAIAASGIDLSGRTLASQNIQKGTFNNSPIVRNDLFEIGETGQSYELSSQFWRKTSSSGVGTWTTSTDKADSGTKSIKLATSSTPFTGEISQQAGIGTVAGELLVCSIAVWQELTISSGLFQFFVEFSDSNGDLLSTLTQDLDGGVDVAWRILTPIMQAPVGAVSIRDFGVRCTALDPSVTGTFAYIDSIEVNVEPANPQLPYPFDQRFRQRLGASSIQLMDEDGNFSDPSADVSFDSSSPAGEGSIVVASNNPADNPPALALAGRLFELGSQLLATAANALKPRVSAKPAGIGVSAYTLMWESVSAGNKGYRKYVSPSGVLVETVNASYDNASGDWAKDVGGEAASRIDQANTGPVARNQAAGINSWADAAWATANFKTTDRDGRIRDYWGPEGYRMGPVIEETYRWRIDSGVFLVTGASVSPEMSVKFDANANMIALPGSHGFLGVPSADPQIRARLENGGAGNTNFVLFPTTGGSPPNPEGDMPISDIDNTVSVMEWAMSFNSATLTNSYFGVGFHELDDITGLAVDSNASGFVGIKAETTSANFRAEVRSGAGATTNTDSTIVIVADTMYTFRVEYHGANSPLGVGNGTSPVARFYIDGALVHEETGVNVPVTADVPNWGPAAYGVLTNDPGADKDMFLRTIKCAWNGVLDPSVPVF